MSTDSNPSKRQASTFRYRLPVVRCSCGRDYTQPSPTLRCMCGQVVALQNETTESYRRAVAILADEAEAYLSAVGDEDEGAARIAWAVRRVRESK